MLTNDFPTVNRATSTRMNQLHNITTTAACTGDMYLANSTISSAASLILLPP